MELLADPLHARQSIGAISHQVGFTNQAHFTRLFRSEFGASPGEFRRAQHASTSSSEP
jgi:AraC-like DNA-binding protein